MRRGPGLIGMAARTAVVAGTAIIAVSGRVGRRQQKKYASQDAQYTEEQAAAAAQGVEEGAPAPVP